VHHIRLRSEGGTHDPDNLIVACAMHHGALHRGALTVEGAWSTGMKFLHADGSAYGGPANPRAALILTEVHQALSGLAFKEREARWMVKEICPHVGADATVSLEQAIRRALAMWRGSRTASASALGA
jgi:hypothetical protein